MDVGGRAPTVGALGDAGAIADAYMDVVGRTPIVGALGDAGAIAEMVVGLSGIYMTHQMVGAEQSRSCFD